MKKLILLAVSLILALASHAAEVDISGFYNGIFGSTPFTLSYYNVERVSPDLFQSSGPVSFFQNTSGLDGPGIGGPFTTPTDGALTLSLLTNSTVIDITGLTNTRFVAPFSLEASDHPISIGQKLAEGANGLFNLVGDAFKGFRGPVTVKVSDPPQPVPEMPSGAVLGVLMGIAALWRRFRR